MKRFEYNGKPKFIDFIEWLIPTLDLPEGVLVDPTKVSVSAKLYNALADNAATDPMLAWAFINKGPKKDDTLADNEVVYEN